MSARATAYDLVAVLAASVITIAGLLYAEATATYDATTLLVSVVMPVVLGSAIFSLRRDRVLLYAFLGYIWAMVDDRPVFFDSVLTWPEVTRFNPFLPRLLMNVVIHALTIVFLYLSVREAMKGAGPGPGKVFWIALLSSLAFTLAYAQNIPLAAIQNVVQAGNNPASWYPFDAVAKLSSIFFFFLALREAGVFGRRKAIQRLVKQDGPDTSSYLKPSGEAIAQSIPKISATITQLGRSRR